MLVAAPRKGSPDARHITEHLEELTRLVDTKNVVVHGDRDIRTVVVGIEDAVVVTTPDAVLVTTRARAGDIWQLVADG